ncbi:MAG: hypothetical protein KJ072_04855 [Verrucomicrobia bacterium]|nr:hypothetical protein [Verrucomicrobiota bacterium]
MHARPIIYHSRPALASPEFSPPYSRNPQTPALLPVTTQAGVYGDPAWRALAAQPTYPEPYQP